MRPQQTPIFSIAIKLLVLLASIPLSSKVIQASEREAQVMERVEVNEESSMHRIESFLHLKRKIKGLHPVAKLLTELNTTDALDGKYFKIVLAESDEAIRFDNPDELLVLRAASTYYHLTQAHDYFVQDPLFQEDRYLTQINSKITVRVDQEHLFSGSIHFSKTPKGIIPGSDLDYTTKLAASLTVPASNPHVKADALPDGTPISDWGNELWFMKAKRRNNKTSMNQLGDMIDSGDFKSSLRSSLLYGDVLNLENDILTTQHPIWQEHGANMLLSLGISEVIPGLFKLGTKVIPEIQEIEPTLIPEIAYHEYTHIVLANIFNLNYSTALNEGYPNYYAGKISGLSRLAARTGKYSKGFSAKNGRSKEKYSFDQEYRKFAAMGSFTYSLLNALAQAFGPEYGEAILMAALDYREKDPTDPTKLMDKFNSATKLKGEFEDAIDFGIRTLAAKQFQDQDKQKDFKGIMRLRAATVFEQKGFFTPVINKK